LSQHQSTGAESHGSQDDHNDTGHPALAWRISAEQATNQEVRSKSVDENEWQARREIDGCTTLAERLKRFLRRDSMLVSNLPKQNSHAAILCLSGGLWAARPIMGVHIPNGQFLCELQIRPEVSLIDVVRLRFKRARPLAVGIAALTSNASGEDEDQQQQKGPMRPNRTDPRMPGHTGVLFS
jgi:hypothetical protein